MRSQQCANVSAAIVSLILLEFTHQFASLFNTAGFGVFAGRAFRKDDIVLRSLMTLFLPNNFPSDQSTHRYVFDHNKTHMALDLDYGSLINHHESYNTKTADNVIYRVHRGFNA